ncbi:lamin tail domain-containing protein [Schleiferiaceae bacterium]|nr:lamin tail domain-containing protein [Schleiferiaceae bacterium]
MKKYLSIVLVCLSYFGFAQTNYVVTFKVNAANITVGSNGIYLGGGVIGGANAVQLTDADGNGVYEGTDTLSGAGGGNFIFLNSPTWNGDWGTKENLAGLACADANNFNDRILPSFTQDTTLMFCYGTCSTDTLCTTTYTATSCGDLFFSEYAEGSSNNKYFEIYNPTASAISLSGYTVYLSGNGGSYTNTFTSGASIASGDVYMISTNQLDSATQTLADTAMGYPSVAHFNGDDALILVNGTDTIDVIGVPGVDPGSSWTVGTGSTANHTLVRKATVDMGSTDWTTGAGEWDVYASNTWTYAGSNSSNCIVTPKNVTFQVDMSNVSASFTNVYVSGTVNNWSGNSNQLTDADGDGVYEGTLSLMPGSYEYKFTYDNWTGQETLDPVADATCTLTTGAFTNRYSTIGNADTTLPVVCWESCNTCGYVAPCSELYFSEYAEGSSNNKYFEIYNPTASAISLSGYTVYLSGNGGSYTNTFTSGASIASGDVYMISTNQLDSATQTLADTAMGYPSVAHFNGDDALILVNGTDTIDVIGVPGVDPGSSWTVGTGSTANHTLVRKATVDMGSTDWTTGAGEWDVYASNTWTYAGSNSSNCIVTPKNVTFQVDMNYVTASFTNVYVSGTINNWSGNSNQLTDADGDGVYEGTLSLMPGSYEYKFTYDNWTGQESLDATLDSACTITTGAFTNRYATFGNADTTLPVVCWEECTACVGPTDFAVTFMVNTANITVGTNGLYLGGGVIGGANAVQLLDPDGDGIYVGTDTLNGSNGGNFIFLNNPANASDWNAKENLAGLACADVSNWNDRILPTFTQDTTLMFCYGTCSTDTSCTVTSTNPDVTFRVDMSNVSASFTNVYVSGTLNSWSGNANQLTDPDGDGVYEADISLAAGNYEFKFTYDNWVGQESLDATLDSACTLTTGAFTNRYITIGASDTTLPVFCWEECTSCATTTTGCTELFFSEYAEGSSNNKYIEIYNPTANAVSLSSYTVYQSGNGGSYTNTFTTNATIASGGVYMIAANQADASILAVADTAMAYPSIAHFNGDDAMILVSGTDTVDIIGVPGVDPGSSWTVGTGSTANHTLVRMASIGAGSTDWTTGATEWDVYAQNTWTYMGAHTSNCIYVAPAPTFDSVVAINTFNSNDANGVADSLGAMKWIKVIVTSIDFDGNAGYSFYGEDATDGINIYNFADQSGYTAPMMGDSLYIHGEVEQFSGLTELKPDSIYLLSSGNALPAASIETALDETTESELIKLIGFTLADATQWPASGSSANVDITNGTDTMTMRIDSDTDIDGSTAPVGTFDVTGIGSQFDFSSPYDEGYQIFPRQLTDIFVYPFIPTYTIDQVDNTDADGVPDSLNVYCKVVGVVHGVDMQGSATAVSFTVHDGTEGLGTYSSVATVASYVVTEGDEVRIVGSIGHFNGLLQMYVDSVTVLSTGNATQTPTVVTALGESTESELVKFENMTMVDPTQWGSGSSGYNIDITNGNDTIVMRIDADVDLYGAPAPTGMFDVVGIGGQFDFSAPHFDGYQLLPRYQADIMTSTGVAAVKLSISEIMAGSNSTAYNADWFEIHNYGDSAVDLSGYSWDDESEIAGTSTFPAVTIQPGEAIVVLDDVAANKDAFLAEWKLYAGSVTIVANDELTGSFPSLSQNGDAVFLYDANGAEMASGVYSAATAGFAVEFDTTGAFLGDAVDGTNGAYTSLEGDVGSPGNLTPNTGVDEASVISNIYPNPTTGSFTVNLASDISYEATITNMTGAAVFHKVGTGSVLEIDLDAARGTYVLRVRTAQGTAVQMIVLQ